jgi:hypothetical protein
VFRTAVAGHVGRYLNFYVADGNGTRVEKSRDFHGALENVDVGSTGVGHLTIDKDVAMQQRVISAIDAVAFSRSSGTSVTQKRPEARAKQSSATPTTANQ